MSPTNCRDRAAMESAQVIPCTKFEAFRASVAAVNEASTICIISCVTEFITSSLVCDSLSLRVDPIFRDFFNVISQECGKFPDRRYLVCPPMYRQSPLWYRDGIAEILTRFSLSYQSLNDENLHLLPSFQTPAFESDGIHLTAYSGLEFVLHLFDSSNRLLDGVASSPDVRESKTVENGRLLGDRVVALEQGLIRLNSSLDLKTAIDAELHDYRANERLEDSFVLTGLKPLPSGLTGKTWQERAQADVKTVVKKLLGREVSVVVVHNVTSRAKGSQVSYNVKLTSAEDSREVRSKFGSFFPGGEDRRPDGFRSIGISNCVTRETRVRIAILKLFGQRYRDSNPGAKSQVVGYQPRPILKLTPPPDSGDKRVRSFNFIEAVQKLPANFSEEEVMPLIKKYGSRYPGKLKSLFVVLSDDLVPPSSGSAPGGRSKRGRSPSSADPEASRPRVN